MRITRARIICSISLGCLMASLMLLSCADLDDGSISGVPQKTRAGNEINTTHTFYPCFDSPLYHFSDHPNPSTCDSCASYWFYYDLYPGQSAMTVSRSANQNGMCGEAQVRVFFNTSPVVQYATSASLSFYVTGIADYDVYTRRLKIYAWPFADGGSCPDEDSPSRFAQCESHAPYLVANIEITNTGPYTVTINEPLVVDETGTTDFWFVDGSEFSSSDGNCNITIASVENSIPGRRPKLTVVE